MAANPTFNFVGLSANGTPETPAPGVINIFTASDGTLSQIDSAGTVTAIGGGSGGTVTTSAPLSGVGSVGSPVTATAAALRTSLGYFSTTVADLDSGASAGASFDLSAAFGGIDGDRDGWYEIDLYIVTPASSNAIAFSVTINGAATVISENVLFTDAGTVSAVADGAFGLSNVGTVNAGFISGTLKIAARTARGARAIQFDGILVDTVTATKAIKGLRTRGVWRESATNITGIAVVASSGNNVGAHSLATVRRPLTIT